MAKPAASTPGSRLGELDLHLAGEGRHERIYEQLGAHLVDGGVSFAVWAPNAQKVAVVGDWNRWDGDVDMLEPTGSSGIWHAVVPGAGEGAKYKFEIVGRDGQLRLKADPFAFAAEVPPKTASVVYRSRYEWQDDDWLTTRRAHDLLVRPLSIYEVHASSWRLGLGWRELAEQLVPYVQDLGYTHVELLPVMHHPFSGSWGYQVTGFYAPVSTLGPPDDFRAFVDAMHAAGIGVLLDWVPAHFPRDEFALAQFDGTALYEHADPRRGAHPDWGTLVFNLGRNEVRNFLLANALYWVREFHADGLRVDAVASMLYLDYSRKEGEWVPNAFGGREDLEAVSFLKELNEVLHDREPGVLSIAEESTAWPGVSRPTYLGGLGFGFKWNMGWMHDTLEYFSKDSIHRRFHHHELTFSLVYAWNENFVLPLSHDEVVHGKGSLLRAHAGRPLAALREPAGALRLHVGASGQAAPLHGRGVRPGARVERAGRVARLAPARGCRPRGRHRRRPRSEPRLPRRAGAVGARLLPRGLPLARAQRGERERARLRAGLEGRDAVARLPLQPLTRGAEWIPRRSARRRALARGAQHRLPLLRRVRRRQRLGRRDRAGAVDGAGAVGRGHAAAARDGLARARDGVGIERRPSSTNAR